MEDSKLLSTSEISKHNSPEDCWLVIDDQVWDCTGFAGEHPGGSSCGFSQFYLSSKTRY